jgi:cytochrome c556
MNIVTKVLVAGLLCAGSVALAGEATDPTVKARQDLMGVFGKNMKVLGEMASDKVAFDAAAAEAAKAELIAASAEIAAKFEAQATDPESEAKAEIWTNWDDFVAKGNAMNAAATGLDATSLDGVKAGMGALGGACKACHTAYRAG